MDAALCAAELTARNSHEHPDMPWDFHVDMARQTWDEIRHAEIFDRLMATELGCHWGDYPVGFNDFRSVYALDLAGRLAVYDGISEQMAQQRKALVEGGQDELARVFDHLLADEATHVHNGAALGLERHLAAALAAGAAALGDRLLAGLERLAQPAAERTRSLARAAAAEAEHLLAAALGMAREARGEEGQDQQHDAERDHSDDGHVSTPTRSADQ